MKNAGGAPADAGGTKALNGMDYRLPGNDAHDRASP